MHGQMCLISDIGIEKRPMVKRLEVKFTDFLFAEMADE